jgi:hypothetical protein
LLSPKSWKDDFILHETLITELESREEFQRYLKTGMPSIGFLPKERKLIVLDNIKGIPGTVYMFDMVLSSWTKIEGGLESPNKYTGGTNNVGSGDMVTSRKLDYSSFVNAEDGELMLRHFDDDAKSVRTWQEYEVCSLNESGHEKCQRGWKYDFKTKDIDFGFPGVRKKIYKVYLSYKLYGNTAYTGVPWDYLNIKYSVDGKPGLYNFRGVDEDSGEPLTDEDETPLRGTTASIDGWSVAQLVPYTPSIVSNIYSFKLSIYSDVRIAGLEINDITIIFRTKNVK